MPISVHDAIRSVVRRLLQAYSEQDTDALHDMLLKEAYLEANEDSTVLMIGTGEHEYYVGRQTVVNALRADFASSKTIKASVLEDEAATEHADPGATLRVARVPGHESVCWFDSKVVLHAEFETAHESRSVSFVGRLTGVVVSVEGAWRFAQLHLSSGNPNQQGRFPPSTAQAGVFS